MAPPTIASVSPAPPLQVKPPNMTARFGLLGFGFLLCAGLFYTIAQLFSELSTVRESSAWPSILLGFALVIALGFEFVLSYRSGRLMSSPQGSPEPWPPTNLDFSGAPCVIS